jgi:RNA polymerase sigma-70 factor (ECF subfamily)
MRNTDVLVPSGENTPPADPAGKIQELFISYYPALLSLASRYVSRAIAEDLVQDVFARLWEGRGQLAGVRDAPAYLYQMTRYRCLNHVRDEKARERATRRFLDDWSEEELDAYVEEETFRRLMESIEKLPAACRAILTLGLQGHKAREIAARLDLAISTVKKQQQIARRALKRELGLLAVYLGGLWTRLLHLFPDLLSRGY